MVLENQFSFWFSLLSLYLFAGIDIFFSQKSQEDISDLKKNLSVSEGNSILSFIRLKDQLCNIRRTDDFDFEVY